MKYVTHMYILFIFNCCDKFSAEKVYWMQDKLNWHTFVVTEFNIIVTPK